MGKCWLLSLEDLFKGALMEFESIMRHYESISSLLQISILPLDP